MKLEDLTAIEQLTDFLTGTQAVAFAVMDEKGTRYRWIQRELVKFRYPTLHQAHKGVWLGIRERIIGIQGRSQFWQF